MTSYRDFIRGDRDSLTFWGLLIAAVVALAVLVTITLAPREGAGPLEARATPYDFGSMPPLNPPPQATISVPPLESPSAAPTGAPTAEYAAAPRRTSVTPSHRPRPSASATPSRTARPPVWAAWMNKRVALEINGQPGLLLRHRDFVARADTIGGASRALDRADATFVVRPGLADDDCLSFEATNHDNFYLRHRDFVLRLNRQDGSSLFRADATFCPEPAIGDGLTLRAVNYPDRRLALQWSRVALSPVSPSRAMRVRLRPPP